MGTMPDYSIVAQLAEQVTALEKVLVDLKEFAATNPTASITDALNYADVRRQFDKALKGDTT